MIPFFFDQLLTVPPSAKRPYSDYTLEELKELTILQRLALHNWSLEYVTLGFTLVFIIFFKIGDFYNQSIVTKFLKGLNGVFTENFFQYGVTPSALYIKDSSENYSSYASGRQNIAKVNINFKLKARHNIFVLIMETILSYFTDSVPVPVDKVDIFIYPADDVQYDNFIQAIVSKLGMNDFRKFNYYLSLTRTVDSTEIPESFVFMSEVNEIQEKIAIPELTEGLSLSSASFLKFISFTDQPIEKPEAIRDLLPRRRVIISANVTTNKQELAELSKVLNGVFIAIDKLASKEITFKTETLRKVVKIREVEVQKIQKLLDEVKEQEIADEKAKAKAEEKARLRSLPRDEQIKAEKKALEKKQRKMQKKQRIKM